MERRWIGWMMALCLAGLAACSPLDRSAPAESGARAATAESHSMEPAAADTPNPSATAEAPATATATEAPTDVPVAPTASPLPPGTPTVAPGGPAIAHLAAGQTLTLTRIDLLDNAVGWGAAQSAADANDRLMQTSDGAQTWSDRTPPQPVSADPTNGQAVVFAAWDAATAWATYGDRFPGPLTGTPFVWRTTDGGASWQASTPLDVSDAEFYGPSNMTFVDPQTGWLLVHVGAGMMHDYVMLYATKDGGLTWDRVVDPFSETEGGLMQGCGKTGMAFSDNLTGWITGDCYGVQPGAPYLYHTADGGLTWALMELPAPPAQPDLFQNETQIACGVQAPLYAAGPAVVLAVTCQDFNTGQGSAWLYRTADSGTTWSSKNLATAYSAGDFLSPDLGWVLGSAGDPVEYTLAATADGGQTLTPVKKLAWTGQLDFIDPQTGWAVARAGEDIALVRSIDGGKTWKVIAPVSAP